MKFSRLTLMGPEELKESTAESIHRPFLYLACPYASGSADYTTRCLRFDAATRAAGALLKMGFKVFSPITHSHPIVELTPDLPLHWPYWERYDRAMIEHSHALIVLTLEGWMESPGVQAEMALAREQDIPVFLMAEV